ncbi:Uncharacterized protein FWK35_00018464 [Aphis craccivora]|uniref:Uncharacterized protein n=2 Tax=Aphis craccivora TaxID=307492 RepID=A0A6G0Y643_APHCR|nr:Uncharacterized protein FWK35_00018464 [Aphis craccivora]
MDLDRICAWRAELVITTIWSCGGTIEIDKNTGVRTLYISNEKKTVRRDSRQLMLSLPLYVLTYTGGFHSERIDECIDFTMLCVFFLCLCTRESVKIMLQFQTLGVVSDSKMDLVGALGRLFFEFPNSFQKRREKPKKKIKEKREFLLKTSFRPNRFFYMVVIQKLITLFIDHRNFRFFLKCRLTKD